MAAKERKKMSIDNMRIGKSYFLRNHGDTTSFIVLETTSENDYTIKDLLTLEIYKFNTLIRYGTGEDFELYEI